MHYFQIIFHVKMFFLSAPICSVIISLCTLGADGEIKLRMQPCTGVAKHISPHRHTNMNVHTLARHAYLYVNLNKTHVWASGSSNVFSINITKKYNDTGNKARRNNAKVGADGEVCWGRCRYVESGRVGTGGGIRREEEKPVQGLTETLMS